MHETVGLRERKKAETRSALGQAALRLALERGVDGVSADEIAAAANVSVRTFHNYFNSKDSAVIAGFDDYIGAYVDELTGRPSSEPIWESLEVVLASVIVTVGELATHGPAQIASLWTSPALVAYRSVLVDEMRQALVETIASRTDTDIDTDLYPHLVAAAAGSAFITAIKLRLGPGRDEPDRVRLLHECFALLRAGLPEPVPSRH
jgi:AcrR family transcriptional regulator